MYFFHTQLVHVLPSVSPKLAMMSMMDVGTPSVSTFRLERTSFTDVLLNRSHCDTGYIRTSVRVEIQFMLKESHKPQRREYFTEPVKKKDKKVHCLMCPSSPDRRHSSLFSAFSFLQCFTMYFLQMT